MYHRKVLAWAVAFLIALSSIGTASAKANDNNKSLQSIEPLNLAVLIQDDLVSQVANEIGVTKDFIRSLPQGSQVMVGYITSGTLQIRQPLQLTSRRLPSRCAFRPRVAAVRLSIRMLR